jgi:outer membrane protein
MKAAKFLGAAASAAVMMFAAAAHAADSAGYVPEGKGRLVVDLRVTDVVPEANDPIYTAAGVDTTLRARVGDSIMPTLGVKYFLTDNIAAALILGFTEHDAFAVAPDGTSTKVHSTWVLPPVLTVLYHPFPKARISPYAGVGVNAMVYFSGSDYNGFHVKLRDEFGYAVQFGFDVPITHRWQLNFDAKKVFTDTNANINGGALYSHIGLSPWVASVGIGRRF